MGTVVLDSSVVLAVLDSSDVHNVGASAALANYHHAGHSFTVPTTVLAEVLVGEARRNNGDVRERRAAVAALFGGTRTIDDEVAVVGARLRAEHRSLRLPDALVLAIGIVDAADVVLTADKRWRKFDDRVVVLS